MKIKNKIFFVFLFAVMLIIHDLPRVSGADWCEVYFTSPEEKTGKQLNRLNPETGLVEAIKNSKYYFYGAFYELTSKPVIEELINAGKRGVTVRLVMEGDNYSKPGMKNLINSGIKIVTDERKGLMHNKFAVIDGRTVWTGSYNPTYNGAYKNNNNAVKIISEDLAVIYIQEFDEMFKDRIFGNKKELTVFQVFKNKYYCKIGTTDINIYFSPEDNIERIIIKRIKKAKNSIHFMAFSFTSDKIARELIRLRKKGIKISGVIEKTGAKSRYSEYNKLRLEDIDIRLDRNKKMMHHKVIVIDGRLLITGSYNFSKNANEKNDENIIIVDNKSIAEEYLKEFFHLFK